MEITPQLCEDAISRQALLNATVHKNSIWNKITDSKGENLESIISKLPSMTPQEPFMATPCISSKVCEHDRIVTLDKIRAEIEELDYITFDGITKRRCLEIIDKYKAESEE